MADIIKGCVFYCCNYCQVHMFFSVKKRMHHSCVLGILFYKVCEIEYTGHLVADGRNVIFIVVIVVNCIWFFS